MLKSKNVRIGVAVAAASVFAVIGVASGAPTAAADFAIALFGGGCALSLAVGIGTGIEGSRAEAKKFAHGWTVGSPGNEIKFSLACFAAFAFLGFMTFRMAGLAGVIYGACVLVVLGASYVLSLRNK